MPKTACRHTQLFARKNCNCKKDISRGKSIACRKYGFLGEKSLVEPGGLSAGSHARRGSGCVLCTRKQCSPRRLKPTFRPSMAYYQGEQTLSYNWEQVLNAFWRRYPNPHSKHVLTEDIVSRRVDQDGRLFTKRLLSKTNSAPKWTERFLPSKVVYIVEESIVDLKSKTLTTYTRNIGMQHLMCLQEKVVYKPHEDCHSMTVSERQAWVNSTFYGLSSAIQRLGLERYKQNIKKTYKGFSYTLEMLYGKHASDEVKNIQTFNPMLKQKLKESASKASEFAKSNIPLVIAAERQDNK